MPTARNIFKWAGMTLLVAMLVAASGALLTNTDAARAYILKVVVQRAQQAAGQTVGIRAIEFHWFPLRVRLSGVQIGDVTLGSPLPLFSLDDVEVGIGIGIFHRPNVRLRSVVLVHPVLHLYTDPQGRIVMGPSRPAAAVTGNSPGHQFFDLGIDDVTVKDGEIYFDDRPAAISAEAHDLAVNLSHALLDQKYDGSLRYDRGLIRMAGYQPLQHTLEATFQATTSAVSVKSLTVESGTSRLTARADLSNFSRPELHGSYEVSLSANQLGAMVSQPVMRMGAVETQGSFSYAADPVRPFLANLQITGKLAGTDFAIVTSSLSAPIRDVTAEYELAQGNAYVRNARFDLLGGQIAGTLIAKNISSDVQVSGDAGIEGLRLLALQQAAALQKSGGPIASGIVNGTAHGEWQRAVGVQVRSDLTIAVQKVLATSAAIPVSGTIHANYDGQKDTLSLHDSSLQTARTIVVVNGTLAKSAVLQIGVQANDLGEIDRLATAFRSKFGRSGTAFVAAQPLGISGKASFNGTVTGNVADPTLSGLLNAGPFKAGNAAFALLRGNISVNAAQLALHQGELRTVAQGHADFDGTVGLSKWNFSPQSQIMLHLTADKLAVGELEQLGGLHYQVDGTLSANVDLAGSEENPTGKGTVRMTQASAWGQPIDELNLQTQGNGTQIELTAGLRTPAGNADVTLTYGPKDGDYAVKASSPRIELAALQYAQSLKTPIAGSITGSLTGHGNVKQPELEIAMSSQDLQLGAQKIDGFGVHANIAQQKAAFSVDAKVSGASINAHGSVMLQGDYQTSATIDTQKVEIGPLLASYFPGVARDVHGQTQLHGSVEGPLATPANLKVEIDVPTLTMAYRTLQFGAARPLHLALDNGDLVLSKAEFRGTGTEISVEGSVPVRNGGTMRAAVNGGVDLSLLQLVNRDWQSSGKVEVQASARGSAAHPELQGNARLSNAVLLIPDVPGIENATGEIDFDGQRAVVKTLSGQIGGGPFQISGTATYASPLQLNLGMHATGMRLLYPDGVRTLLDANLSLTGDSTAAVVSGRVTLNQVSVAKEFDLASVTQQLSGGSPPSTGFVNNVRLNITVSSSDQLAVSTGQVSVAGNAQLRVQGTAAEPVIVGRTTLTGGELFFEGKRFEITQGVIQFSDPTRTTPILNISATTVVDQFNINIGMMGPFDRLHVNYSSDPPLPPVDVISLLISGRTTEAAQASPTTPTELLAGQITGQVSSRLQKLTGISSLTIDPQIGGNQGDAASQLALQERVTKNMLFTFSTNVTNAQGPAVGVQYQATQKYALSATRDQSGGYQVEVKLHKTF
jgi:translocation and assembly module TamB